PQKPNVHAAALVHAVVIAKWSAVIFPLMLISEDFTQRSWATTSPSEAQPERKRAIERKSKEIFRISFPRCRSTGAYFLSLKHQFYSL
ncbi:MAG: hypothetical protein O2863_03435, partial [Actinomycetota bacterium]|nr:hypothetical protein [Actinomycetota bacterium]